MATLNFSMGVGTHLTDGILVEPIDPAYARAAIAVDAIQSGQGVNNAQAVWGPCSADWGGIAYAALYDDQGNHVVAWPLPATYTVTVAGDAELVLPAAALAVTAGPAWAADLVRASDGSLVYQSNGEPARTS